MHGRALIASPRTGLRACTNARDDRIPRPACSPDSSGPPWLSFVLGLAAASKSAAEKLKGKLDEDERDVIAVLSLLLAGREDPNEIVE